MSQAAARVLEVLRHVASEAEPVSVMTVAAALQMDKSTCSRLLALLVDQQWLVRNEQSRLFSAGPVLLGVAARAAMSNQLQALLLPALTSLRDTTGETVSFHRRVGDHRVCVAGLESRHQIRRVLPIGDSFLLPIGPSGKAILAFIDQRQRDALIHSMHPEHAEQVRTHLTMVRDTGAVTADADHIVDVGAVSAPVFGTDGVFGALTIAGPLPRWSEKRRRQVLPDLLREAASISEALGAPRGRFDKWLKRSQETTPAGV
ncbi:IclR family transcriptional regulator [Amycolatopsis sacchari]|uniref:IclR family transcriptional regulator n=1 Tax=Amycolatopsis sacchari TaxID=115433 RepID=UPI003EBB0840